MAKRGTWARAADKKCYQIIVATSASALTHPFHPRRRQASQHREDVEREEASNGHEQFPWHDPQELAFANLLDVRVNRREDRQGHEESEEHVEELHERLSEDEEVRRAGLHVDARSRGLLLLLLAHHLVVAVELVQRHGEVRVEAQQNDENSCDEEVYGRLPHRGPNGPGENADYSRKSAADVGTEHHGSGVFRGKLSSHSVCLRRGKCYFWKIE